MTARAVARARRAVERLRAPRTRATASRLAPALVSVGLLAASAAAFAVTEMLKLEPTPIVGPKVDKVFSPVCECPSLSAEIFFRLRRSDTLTLDVLDDEGRSVRTIVDGGGFSRGLVGLSWDGRDDAGALVPEGEYHARIVLERARRTIVLPDAIQVDVTPPELRLVGFGPKVFSPDGDGRADKVKFRFRVSELARAFLFVRGERRLQSRLEEKGGTLEWYGKRGGRGLSPGAYRAVLVARDQAGNASRRTASVVVRVRYIELGARAIRIRARTRFGVRVLTDARSYRWRLGRRSGVRRRSPLVLRAPSRRGRYRLVVTANGRQDVAFVYVRRRAAR